MGDVTPLGRVLDGVVTTGLDGRSSHDVGPEPRSRHPPGCTGDPDPCGREHHRDCVVADRWSRACAVGNCQYWDPQASKPDRTKDCPGHRGERRVVGGRCVVTWPGHCARRTKWGAVHQHPKPVRGTRPTRAGDERAPWDRDPGEEG